MTTVRALITAALRKIEVVGAGEVATAEDAFDCLEALNDMIDSWSVSGNLIYTESREQFPLTAGIGQYTMGPSGDFDTARPYRITDAFLTDGSGLSIPLAINSSDQYAQISNKNTQGTPSDVYYDGNYPLANLIFYAVPNQSYTVNIYSQKPLSNFTDINAEVIMPPGYKRALIHNLAVEVAPEYGKQASQSVIYIATQSRQAIENANTENDKQVLRVDQALLYNSMNYKIDIR